MSVRSQRRFRGLLPGLPRAAALPCLLAALALGGCYKSLFPSDLPRNQFENHDKMRQVYTPLEEPDVFGTPQPALRSRLGNSAGQS